MSLARIFISAVTGLVAGWLTGQSERRPGAMRSYTIAGLLGGILGGLVFDSWFFVPQEEMSHPLIFLFDCLAFNVAMGITGVVPSLWITEVLRKRQSPVG
jgi:uncharacterized membrane protein YeaQ/YmgE (transglycosylase-associated protein family)